MTTTKAMNELREKLKQHAVNQAWDSQTYKDVYEFVKMAYHNGREDEMFKWFDWIRDKIQEKSE